MIFDHAKELLPRVYFRPENKPVAHFYELNIQLRISLGQFMTYEIRVETLFFNKTHFYGKMQEMIRQRGRCETFVGNPSRHFNCKGRT